MQQLIAGTPAPSSTGEISVAWLLGEKALPAHVDPDQIALRWDGGHHRAYGQLRDRSLRLARSLRASGLVRGDSIAVHFLNRGEVFEFYFACAYAGLTLVPVNFRLTAHEIGLVLADSGARMIFTQRSIATAALDAAAAAGAIPVVTLDDGVAGDAYEALMASPKLAPPFDYTDPHLILYTSGTTGRPKGVVFHHHSIMWFALQQSVILQRFGADAVTLIIGPTYNTAGINEQSIPTFLTGGTVALHPSRGWTAERTADFIERWAVTHTIIYPSMMLPLLEADTRASLNLSSLRWVQTGGENCPAPTLSLFRQRWPHISLCNAYGSTESGIVSLIRDDDLDRHSGSVGKQSPVQAFKIVRSGGEEAAVNEVGAIWTRGPAVTRGYWNAPELNAEVLQDGWLDTGDLGWIDADGYLYLSGRARELIISKAQNIYPAEIESAIMTCDDVLDCSVVGIPDTEFGEVVCAVVVAKPGRSVSEEGILDHLRPRLASYKKPRHVMFVDEIPRNPSQKVRRSELALQVAERLGSR